MPAFSSLFHSSSLRVAPGLLLVAIGGLSACTTPVIPAQDEHNVDVPARWQQTATSTGQTDPATLAKWWHRFDDPTLTALIESALQASPDIRTALAKIEEARARYGVQHANLLPSVSASISDQSSRRTNRPTDVTTKSESAGASLDASWEIDLFGQARLTTKATAADLAQAGENLHDAQVSLAAEVASTYVSLRAAEAELKAVEASVATREETLQLTRWREQAGTGSTLETQQAITTLQQARASIPTLQQTLTATRNQLALLCSKTPGALDLQLGRTAQVPVAPGDLAIGIPAETLRQRPDVRAAGYAVEAAGARTSSARRDRFPSLSLNGSVGVDALSAGKLFSPENTISNVIGSLSAPIFTAGRIKQTIAIQTAAERQVLIAYESTVLKAFAEVENALAQIRHTTMRLDRLDQATVAAREAATLARQQYEAGQIDFLSVLDSERTLLGLEQNLVSTRADQTIAHIQLYKALGGGWSPDSPPPQS